MKKRTILIPLDGSEFRNQALSFVRHMFDPTNTEIFLLLVESGWGSPEEKASHYYAFAGDMLYYPSESILEQSMEARDRYRNELAEQLQKEAAQLRKAGYTVSTKICSGELAPTIVKEAQNAYVDAIAMVTHGRTGLSRILYGSVADEVLRTSSIPVMMMRSPLPLTDPSGQSIGEIHY